MNHPLGSQLNDYTPMVMMASVGLIAFLATLWQMRREKREIEARKHRSSTKP